MSHSAVVFPRSYPAFEQLPEGEDHWFTVEELVAFIHYTQPRCNWDRLPRAWPWRWEDGRQKFSAYAVWRRLDQQRIHHLMPPNFVPTSRRRRLHNEIGQLKSRSQPNKSGRIKHAPAFDGGTR